MRVVVRPLEEFFHLLPVRLDPGEGLERRADFGIDALSSPQALLEHGHDVHDIREVFPGLPEGPRGQELQEQRQVVRQLVGGHLEAVRRVELLQLHHGLSPVAALPVDVLEQMERERPRPIEEEDVALLDVVEVTLGELGGEPAKRSAPPLGQHALLVENRRERRGRRRDLLCRVGEQEGQHLEGADHRMNSVGVRTVTDRRRGPPKRFGRDDPPELSLPKLKPHEPWRS